MFASGLFVEWEKLVPEKWAEIRKSKGYFIYVFRPQIGYSEDHRLRRATTGQVMAWTVEWFAERGHAIECVLDNDEESFGIRLVND